jgi:hypothetical protein
MSERESGTAGTVTSNEIGAHPHAGTAKPRTSGRTIWVIVLTLPVTIALLAIALEVFGFLLRLAH